MLMILISILMLRDLLQDEVIKEMVVLKYKTLCSTCLMLMMLKEEDSKLQPSTRFNWMLDWIHFA